MGNSCCGRGRSVRRSGRPVVAGVLSCPRRGGCGTADRERGEADREHRTRAQPGAAVGWRADRPGPRVGPGLEQGVLGEGHVAQGQDPGEQAARSAVSSPPLAIAAISSSSSITTSVGLDAALVHESTSDDSRRRRASMPNRMAGIPIIEFSTCNSSCDRTQNDLRLRGRFYWGSAQACYEDKPGTRRNRHNRPVGTL